MPPTDDAIRQACARRQRENPTAWEDDLDELAAVALDTPQDTSAGEEWPEYNDRRPSRRVTG